MDVVLGVLFVKCMTYFTSCFIVLGLAASPSFYSDRYCVKIYLKTQCIGFYNLATRLVTSPPLGIQKCRSIIFADAGVEI